SARPPRTWPRRCWRTRWPGAASPWWRSTRAGSRPTWAATRPLRRRRSRRPGCCGWSRAWIPARAAASSTGAASRCPGERVIDIILHQPEIPPNTGNAIRLCANTGARLHLVRPLGFDIEDRQLRRAGLDYHAYARVQVHQDLAAALGAIAPPRLFALTARGAVRYDAPRYREGDAFLFGRETSGLPEAVLATVPDDHRLHLPMRPGHRSLNLSNAVAVVAVEAWRQLGFAGAAGPQAHP